MSLNGLDDGKIKEVHDAAATEPGGWFLLKYAARDEVGLLQWGSGGIVEIRKTITKYEELSPLFGFLRYRRRNVLIKYIPESCSRLVKARGEVHFNAFSERFTPHDTVFPIIASKELRDTALSAACSTHTACGSISSSTSSLRKRRLMEIAEDEEDEKNSDIDNGVEEGAPPVRSPDKPVTSPVSPPSTQGLLNSFPQSPSYQSTNTSLSLETSPPPPREPKAISPFKEAEPRKSSQSTRPNLSSNSSFGSNRKPKVKLAPRPSIDAHKRPQTSAAASFHRQISTLPAGFRMSPKSPRKDTVRPQSQYDTKPQNIAFRPPPIPESDVPPDPLPLRPHTSGGRPNTSSGASMRSKTSKAPTISLEKVRLLKAIELRKKQKICQVTNEAATYETLQKPGTALRGIPGAQTEVNDTLALLDHMAKEQDSNISFDARSSMKTYESDATRSDSSLVSPAGVSETAGSTRASSISESTDGTVQENEAAKDTSRAWNHSKLQHHTVAEAEEPSLEEEYVVQKNKHLVCASVSEINTTTESSQIEHSASTSGPAESHALLLLNIPSSRLEVLSMVEQVGKPDVSTHTITTSSMRPSMLHMGERSQSPLIEVKPDNLVRKAPTCTKENCLRDSNIAIRDPETNKLDVPAVTAHSPLLSGSRLLPTLPSSIESTDLRDIRQPSPDIREGYKPSAVSGIRRGYVEPIRTHFEPVERVAESEADEHFSSDDDLMDELQSAVVQEAKPISVSKSPMTPIFPSPKKRPFETNGYPRAESLPLHNEESESTLLTPSIQITSGSMRSVSSGAAYLNRINSQSSRPMAKKVIVGSPISQRIKAFEQISNASDALTTTTARPVSTASTAFFSVPDVRPSLSSPSLTEEHAGSLTRPTPSPGLSHSPSSQSSLSRNPSRSVKKHVETTKFSPGRVGHGNIESISVTAQIIRDPRLSFQARADVDRDAVHKPLHLKDSPLVINHQKSSRPARTPPPEIMEDQSRGSTSLKGRKERRSSITIVKDLINDRRSLLAERRRSEAPESSDSTTLLMSPNRSPSTSTSPNRRHRLSSSSSRQSFSGLSPPQTSSSPVTATSPKSFLDDNSDKKANRASRMLRRMSSSFTSSRRTLAHSISPTVREDPEPPSNRNFASHSLSPEPCTTPTSIPIGDVNVQFPDTLLWKRRCVLLDAAGSLILSPALTSTNNNKDKAALGATRRFSFGDFAKAPSIPDVEMQELPNSVVLDFVDGTGLQIACEDRAGQRTLLNILQEAHCSWWSNSRA